MFEEVRQELGVVLQQSFLETDPRYFLSLVRLVSEIGPFGLGIHD